tara:strand:+ start:6631 stop:6858 length:228 start_codon:yes stop_codon:yes gene_type:complete
MMLTLKRVNKRLSQLGLNVELVKGDGYFYCIGDDVEGAYSTSIFTYRLNDLDMERWVSEVRSIIESKNESNFFGE